MLEGKLYYHEKEDYWYLIDANNEKFNVSQLIYGLASLGHFDDESWVGEGEHFKVTLEVNGEVQKGKVAL